MTAGALVFVVALLIFKTGILNKKVVSQKAPTLLGTETIQELVSKDTDQDGIADWEEGLWGTDPMKKETTPGIPDNMVIEKLRIEKDTTGNSDDRNKTPGSITQTDQFARELFTTVATLNQNGSMDQASIDKLSDSLATQIKNPAQKKIYTLSDIKIAKDNSKKNIQIYNNILTTLQKKYPLKESIITVIAESIKSGTEDIDMKVLNKLDPTIKQMNGIISEMLILNVPPELAVLHLNAINSFQKMMEILNDIKLVDTDVIVAMGAISQYEKNTIQLQNSISKLFLTIKQKLSN